MECRRSSFPADLTVPKPSSTCLVEKRDTICYRNAHRTRTYIFIWHLFFEQEGRSSWFLAERARTASVVQAYDGCGSGLAAVRGAAYMVQAYRWKPYFRHVQKDLTVRLQEKQGGPRCRATLDRTSPGLRGVCEHSRGMCRAFFCHLASGRNHQRVVVESRMVKPIGDGSLQHPLHMRHYFPVRQKAQDTLQSCAPAAQHRSYRAGGRSVLAREDHVHSSSKPCRRILSLGNIFTYRSHRSCGVVESTGTASSKTSLTSFASTR